MLLVFQHKLLKVMSIGGEIWQELGNLRLSGLVLTLVKVLQLPPSLRSKQNCPSPHSKRAKPQAAGFSHCFSFFPIDKWHKVLFRHGSGNQTHFRLKETGTERNLAGISHREAGSFFLSRVFSFFLLLLLTFFINFYFTF